MGEIITLDQPATSSLEGKTSISVSLSTQKTICQGQVDPNNALYKLRPGCGNCKTCKPSDQNKNCPGYVPFHIGNDVSIPQEYSAYSQPEGLYRVLDN